VHEQVVFQTKLAPSFLSISGSVGFGEYAVLGFSPFSHPKHSFTIGLFPRTASQTKFMLQNLEVN
jgi:hypothetical protein